MHPVARLLPAICLLLPLAAHARVEERRSLPDIHELPASTMQWPQQAPVLSGLEWSTIAPPGMLLHPVEDEPYIYNQGAWHKGLPYPGHGLSSIQLMSHDPAGGSFQAVASLRMSPVKGDANPLRLSFDESAAYMARRSQIAREQRTDSGYSVTEMRSPLGLTDPRDKENCSREYIGYSAVLPSPLMHPTVEGDPVYSSVSGELRVLRVIDGSHYLLTVEFAARDYPFAIALTKNIACMVLEQFVACEPDMCLPQYEPYIAEWYWPVADSALLGQLDESTADLVEQPDSGLHPSHFPELLEQPAPRGNLSMPPLPEAPVHRLPEGESLLEITPDGSFVEAPEEDWADLPYIPRSGNARSTPRNPLDGWLDEPLPPRSVPVNPLEGWLDDGPETNPAVAEEHGEPAHADPVQDAVGSAPAEAVEPQPEVHLPPKLPRLFEGWGSPRSRSIPATPDMLNPFAGWLHDSPGDIAAEVAKKLKRRERRGR
ncbi:MAG: hypothetical protein H7A35_15700 [Planctomycetales bacterium]|nr:hypothetical protein [bacterium]UNM08272.1 MAG: hypothetical protein H7A35_15700 [Planctomycetales bacterium]